MTVAAVSTSTRICPVCGTHFERISHGKYCNPKCTKIAGRAKSKSSKYKEGEEIRLPSIYKCEKCCEPFASLVQNAKLCSVCKVLPAVTLQSVSTKSRGAGLACQQCKHWVPTPGAELGYSCSISFWMKCKPYLPQSHPFAPI